MTLKTSDCRYSKNSEISVTLVNGRVTKQTCNKQFLTLPENHFGYHRHSMLKALLKRNTRSFNIFGENHEHID